MTTTPDETVAALHNRAGQSNDELRKLLTSMSIASIGVFFIALTNERSSSLDPSGRLALWWAIFLLALSVFFGVAAWFSAGRAFYAKAKEKNPEYKGLFHSVKVLCDALLIFCFLAGIGVSTTFLVIHVQRDASAPVKPISAVPPGPSASK